MSRQKEAKTLRWGYSTGACAAAAATAAWRRLTYGETSSSIRLRFLDGNDRFLPLAEPSAGRMAAIRKDAGDDPDCTHGAILYANIRLATPDEAKPEDYALAVGGGLVILRAAEGVGLCTRFGLDCEQGRWAINIGPRRMIADNLRRAGLDAGCWLLEIGVEDGGELAKRTLNHLLGIEGGISVLGTTGLVRPYSHEAYRDTIRICVKSHHISGGSTMVFCTGGRTKSGAEARLPDLPETAFVSIGDFIADSLAFACRYGMREIIVACMAGKLCKYAAGFANTHAHKVNQDMELLRAEVRKVLPAETTLHRALARSVSVREALLSLPEAVRPELLHRLAGAALEHFAHRCQGVAALRLFIFDFDGSFLFEKTKEASMEEPNRGEVVPTTIDESESSLILADAGDIVGPFYFMRERQP